MARETAGLTWAPAMSAAVISLKTSQVTANKNAFAT